MARWQKRQDFLMAQTVAAGNSYRWEITREFPIESIIIPIRVKTTAVSTPAFPSNDDAPFNMVKRITVTVADGGRTRNVVDISGPSLLAYMRQINGGLDSTQNIKVLTAGTAFPVGVQTLAYVIPFALPNIEDPIASTMCLPAPRYNSNVILTVQMSDAETDWFNTGTVTATYDCTPLVNRRDIRDPNWIFLDTELTEARFTLSAAATNQMYELQVPGAYTGILLRGYLTDNLQGDPTMSIDTANQVAATTYGEVSLRLLGNVIRRFQWTHARIENELSIYNPAAWYCLSGIPASDGRAAAVFMDFVSDKSGQSADHLGSVMDTNPLMATGARLQLFADNKSASAHYIKVVTHRIFGDLSQLKPRAAKTP